MRTALSISWGKRPIAPIVIEGLEAGLHAAKRHGYDGVELSGNVSTLDRKKLIRELKKHDLAVAAILTGALLSENATLASVDEEQRQAAISGISRAIHLAAEFGALVSVGLPIGGPPGKAAHDRAVDALTLLAEEASEQGARLAIEPVNRYLGTQVRNVGEALALISDVNNPALGITLDVFHANVEEASIPAAIFRAGDRLFHVQLSDSNRLSPGAGHLDFVSIVGALKKAGYNGWLSAEMLPDPDPNAAAERWISEVRNLLVSPPQIQRSELAALIRSLNSDDVFRERAQYFTGSIGLEIGEQDWSLYFCRGQIVKVEEIIPNTGVDLVFSAPPTEWRAVFNGDKHLIKALNPYHGSMKVRGNPVMLASNMRPIFYFFSSLRRMSYV